MSRNPGREAPAASPSRESLRALDLCGSCLPASVSVSPLRSTWASVNCLGTSRPPQNRSNTLQHTADCTVASRPRPPILQTGRRQSQVVPWVPRGGGPRQASGLRSARQAFQAPLLLLIHVRHPHTVNQPNLRAAAAMKKSRNEGATTGTHGSLNATCSDLVNNATGSTWTVAPEATLLGLDLHHRCLCRPPTLR